MSIFDDLVQKFSEGDLALFRRFAEEAKQQGAGYLARGRAMEEYPLLAGVPNKVLIAMRAESVISTTKSATRDGRTYRAPAIDAALVDRLEQKGDEGS